MREVHVCPILMRTVIWENGKCVEECDKDDCPLMLILYLEPESSDIAISYGENI